MRDHFEVRAATLQEWDEAYRGTPGRTYFQSVGWAEIWIAYWRGRVSPAALRFAFDDGTSAVVPLVERQRRTHVAPELASSVVGTYGGVLSGSALTDAHMSVIAGHLAGLPSVQWTGNPFAGVAGPAGQGGMTTRAVALDAGMEATKRNMSKGHRSALSQATRQGVAVRRGSTLADWKSYYGLYRRSLERWGRGATSRYGWPLFDLLRGCEPDVTLWLADLRGEPVAGAVIVGGDRYVGYWHGAASTEAFPSRAVNLLVTAAMEDATTRGARYFDLLPSGGHDGVEAFKRSFGAELIEVPRLQRAPMAENLAIRTYAAARWAAGGWQPPRFMGRRDRRDVDG